MLGFIGFLTDRARILEGLEALLARMADTIEHRNPDYAGASVEAQAGVALGFRRLSTIYLSPAGHQPMASSGGRFIIEFNGEAYNHPELRAELLAAGAAPVWRGRSSTETLLANAITLLVSAPC